MKALGKTIKILAAVMVGLVLLTLLAFVAAQTQTGRDWITAQAAHALSSDGATASIGRLEGTIPFDMRLSEIHLGDADGEYLTATNLTFTLAARSLLRGRVEITRLSADDIAVARLPKSNANSSRQSLAFPHLPFGLAVDTIAVGALRLAAPVVGEPVALSIDGRTSLIGDEATAELAVHRIDGGSGQFALSLSLGGQPAQLKVAADLAEPAGLLLDRVLERTDHVPLAISLMGEGPLADWRGSLAATAGDLARLDVDLAIAGTDEHRFGVQGTLAAVKLLPAAFAPMVGEKVMFDAEFRGAVGGSIQIDRLSVDAAAAQLVASGHYDSSREMFAADAKLTATELAPFSGLAGTMLAGAGKLQLTAFGTTRRPEAKLVVEATGLRADGSSVDRVGGKFHLVSAGDISLPDTRLAITGEGRVENVTRAEAAVPAGLGSAIEWHFSGSSNPTGDKIVIDELGLTSAGLDLTGGGTVRDLGATVDGKAVLTVADLSPFSELAGRELHGNGRVEIAARTAADGNLTVNLAGGLSALTLGGAVDALTGGRLGIDGVALRTADGRTTLEKLELNGAAFGLTADGELSNDRRLNARMRLDVPKLAALGGSLGAKLAGRLDIQATAQGPLDGFDVAVALDGDDVVVNQGRIDRLHATLNVVNLAKPTGRLDGAFRAGRLEGTLGGEFALHEENKLLDVGKLRLAASGSSLEGAMRIALDSGLAAGTMTGRIVDLAPWSSLAGMKLAGRADLKATLSGKTAQAVELSLNGNGITATPESGSAFAVARIAANARLGDLLGAPSGHATIDVAGAETGAAKITNLALKLDSTKPGRFAFSGDARGDFREKFALTTAGEIALEAGGATLHLTRLAGTVAGETIQLTQTLTVTSRQADLAMANLAMTLGSGQISGGFSLKGDGLALALKGQRLPIGLAGKLAGNANVSGNLSFDANLTGTRTKPQGRLVIDGRDLRLAAANRSDLPPLGITAEAVWRGGRVEAKGRIAGPKNEAIGFSGSAPLELMPGALAVRLPPDGALALKLEGTGQFADLEELLPLGEDRIAGAFSLDVSVGGTVAHPRADGGLRISDGRYESMATGTVLSNLALDLAGSREGFVLREFHAGDGEKGQMTARGSVDLAAASGPALDAVVNLESFRVLRRDEANIRSSGTIRVGGAVAAPRVAAQLRVDQGELRPPDRLPPSVTRLDIIEINSATGQQAPPSAPPPPHEPVLPVALDITVELPGQVFVRGRGLDSEWRGKLAISGTSAQPIITGSLETVRGNFSLLGKDFKLTSGTIAFSGDAKIDPALDIQAAATTADITATVQIGGVASAPTLKLSSVPELPQDEIISRVLFGKSVGQITPAQGVQIASAAASLAGGGPGLLDKVRSSLGLDRFDFGSGTTGNNAAGNASSNAATSSLGGTTVSAGKYVAEGVYVGVDQGASTGTSKGKVEIEIAPNVSIETDVGATGGNGIGLNWKLDY